MNAIFVNMDVNDYTFFNPILVALSTQTHKCCPQVLQQRVKKMETAQALTIAQEVQVPRSSLPSNGGALFGRERREGEVSAAVELIKTAAAGFREQDRNFSVAC